MSETWKSTPPSGIQIKISERQSLFKTRKVNSSLKKVEQNDDIWRNVRLAHSCACPVLDNADRIKESAKSEQSVCVARLPQSSQNEKYQKLCIRVLHIYGITKT
jgi:hypothetical protein